MIDKASFMETLRSVAEITKTSATPMSREEILGYFSGMELDEAQQNMVYEYLLMPPEEPVEESEPVEEPQEENEEQEEDSAFFRMYLDELEEIKDLTPEEERIAYGKLLAGDAAQVEPLSKNWLKRIVKLAKNHTGYGVGLEDIVQEGNMGVFLKLSDLAGAGTGITDPGEEVENAAREAMSAFVSESTGEDNSEHTVLAKVTLIHEARRVLAEELGRIPTGKELSDYTKLSEEEINDILAMTKEKGV